MAHSVGVHMFVCVYSFHTVQAQITEHCVGRLSSLLCALTRAVWPGQGGGHGPLQRGPKTSDFLTQVLQFGMPKPSCPAL